MSFYGNKRPCGVGGRHNVTLHRHSPFSMAQAVHDLCIASRRLLWTGRWKGLWTAWPHRFFSRPIFDLINNHLKRIQGRYPQCCTPILCVTSACFSSTPIKCNPSAKKPVRPPAANGWEQGCVRAPAFVPNRTRPRARHAASSPSITQSASSSRSRRSRHADQWLQPFGNSLPRRVSGALVFCACGLLRWVVDELGRRLRRTTLA